MIERMTKMKSQDKTVNMNFRLSKSLRDAMRAKADYLGINMSQFFRNAIENELNIVSAASSVDTELKNVPTEDTKMIGFRCPVKLIDTFEAVCRKNNLQKSVVFRQLLVDYIKDNQ